MMMKRVLLGVCLSAAGVLVKADPVSVWQQSGFDQPESVVAGDHGQFLYVSNIGGQPGEKNGQGYISRLSVDGRVLEKRWVSGLNAPKGMAVSNGQLLVTDIDRLLVIDLASGEVVRDFRPMGAQFLNDVAAGDHGDVYVSDMMANTIYRYDGESLAVWLQDERLMHPNGLQVRGGELVVASWGAPIAADFSTEQPGGLVAVDLEDRVLSAVAGGSDLGNLDGVVEVGDSLYVNDWMNGRLFRVSEAGETAVVADLASGLADIGAAGDVLYLPYMFNGEVHAVRLPK